MIAKITPNDLKSNRCGGGIFPLLQGVNPRYENGNFPGGWRMASDTGYWISEYV